MNIFKTVFIILIISTLNLFSVTQKHVGVDNNIPKSIINKNKSITNKVDSKFYLKNAVHIKFKSDALQNGVSTKAISSLLKSHINTELIKNAQTPFRSMMSEQLLSNDKYGIQRIVTLNFSSDMDPYQMCVDIMKSPAVEYASPIFIRYSSAETVNDPLLIQQYGLDLLKLADAWSVTTGDTNIVIAIVDSGTDIMHEDLQGNIYTNWKEIPNNNIDDDKNGKIDDVHGWDMIGNISVQDYYAGNYKEDNNPINPGNFHGTHVAGCASAVTNNSKGIASPGYKCKLMPIKCAADDPQLGAGILRGYEGILFAAQNGADVVNCSWGGSGSSPAEQDLINTVSEMGVVVVAAAGNDGSFIDINRQYPANYDNVLNVGASAGSDAVASFTNYGNSVTVYTPGSQILSTMPNNSYAREDGTSFSSPLTAGIVALVKSIHPDWTPKQIIRQLRSTSDKTLTGVTGFEHYFVGRANAFKAVTYNNPLFPDQVLPGINAENLKFAGNSLGLNAIGNSKINLDLINYLGKAKNLKITFSAIDNFITINTKEMIIDEISANGLKNIELDIELLPNCPWYQGVAQILLKYDSGDYLDYQVLNLPIQIPTSNVFTKTIDLPTNYQIVAYGASTPSLDVAWIVGQSAVAGSLVYYHNNNVNSFGQLANEPTYCIHAFDAQSAIIGTSPENGLAKVQITNNTAQSWKEVPVSNITPFINYLYFSDRNNGILLGDPIASVWGIAKTNDGGLTWSMINGVPAPLNTETGYVESVAIIGDNIWFGTSQGRVYYSNDLGDTWNVSKTIIGTSLSKMSFMDDKNGYALYNVGSGQTAITFLAYTTDGGENWKTGMQDFSKSGFSPADIHCVPDAGKLLLVSNLNETFESDDNGSSWKPVLTKRLDGIDLAIGLNDGSNVRLWSAGMSGIGFLDVILSPVSERKEISSVSSNPFNYGSIKIGSSKIGKIEFKNSGNVDLQLESVSIIFPEGADTTEFKIMSQPQEDLKPSEIATMNVVFRPKSLGEKGATLKIKNNAEPKELIINLQGVGTDASGVIDFKTSELIKISPNPTFDNLNVHLDMITDEISSFTIYSIVGNELFSHQVDNLIFNISLNNLPAGSYMIIFEGKKSNYISKFNKL